MIAGILARNGSEATEGVTPGAGGKRKRKGKKEPSRRSQTGRERLCDVVCRSRLEATQSASCEEEWGDGWMGDEGGKKESKKNLLEGDVKKAAWTR